MADVTEAASAVGETQVAVTLGVPVADGTAVAPAVGVVGDQGAWSQAIDDDADSGALDVIEDEARWPWRWVAALAAGILGVLGIVAAGIGFGGWGLEQRHPVVVSTPIAAPKPPMPPEAMLNGVWKQTANNDAATYTDSTREQWGDMSPTTVTYTEFSTSCDQSHCTAQGAPPDGKSTMKDGSVGILSLTWTGGQWVGSVGVFDAGGGNLDKNAWVITPDGHGGFSGVETDTLISGPSQGASSTVPFTLMPVRN